MGRGLRNNRLDFVVDGSRSGSRIPGIRIPEFFKGFSFTTAIPTDRQPIRIKHENPRRMFEFSECFLVVQSFIPYYGCVVLFSGDLHRCTELLFYSPVDFTETVVKFISLSSVIHRFNQAQLSGVLK